MVSLKYGIHGGTKWLPLQPAGYRAIAFDFRGYGLSQQPPEPEKASFDDLVVNIIGVMDSLGISKVLYNMPFIKFQKL